MHDLNKLVKDYSTPVEIVVRGDDTVEKTLSDLQNKHIEHKIIYFYVVDKEDRLLGVVPTRKLLFADPHEIISDIMEHAVVRLKANQTLQEAMEVFARHRLLALPVVDEEDRLIGVIDVELYTEDSFNVSDARHRRDVFQLIGLTLEEGKKFSVFKNYRLRMPWIFCNMISGIICAIISDINEQVLSKVIMLAFFIPLVLTLSESVSMQSMTQSLHFIHRPRLRVKQALIRALQEWKVVIFIAASSGIIIGLVSMIWGQGFMPSLTIGVGIIVSITVSAAFGILIPIGLFATRMDPKVASGPVVLMLADVITTGIYLFLATWWLL